MSENKHTPGPWHVDAHTNVMATGGMVAFPGIAAGFDQAANARVIAAAPDLLAACELGIRYLEAVCFNTRNPKQRKNYADAASLMRAAIAKATGSNE